MFSWLRGSKKVQRTFSEKSYISVESQPYIQDDDSDIFFEVEPEAEVNPTPQICLVDLGSDVNELLRRNAFNCVEASVGSLVSVPKYNRNDEHFVRQNHNIPKDLHEYDVLVMDAGAENTSSYDSDKASLQGVHEGVTYALVSKYPQQVFNTKPFGVGVLSQRLNGFSNKKSIRVVFAAKEVYVNYEIVEISSKGNYIVRREHCCNMDLFDTPRRTSKFGRKFKAPAPESGLVALLFKYIAGAEYQVFFERPTVWAENCRVPDADFMPLAFNDNDEVVSYLQKQGESFVCVFPQVVNKADFLLELFNTCFPEIIPEIFPMNGQFGWLDDGSINLPGELALKQRRAEIEKRYLADMASNDNAIQQLKVDYSFLRDMMTGTGEALVKAIQRYLLWLGFADVKSMDDESTDLLEEDIQVDCGERILVIEVKGIGGTSTDKACSQISKIKHRRSEQRRRFDVFGLYIVNHQRFLAPEKRQNPPFTKEQIGDAKLDRRGLLTTYDLYKVYFLIEDGVLEKEYVRERLFDYGVVSFLPSNLLALKVSTIIRNGTVAILELSGVELKVGMKVYARKGGDYSLREILTIKCDDVEVQSASDGEVGICLDKAIKSRSEIFIEKLVETVTPE
ncbi:hypothetical protein ICA16_00415 [Pseudomonas anatoliensis]|uniref:hypothetical protein n=1 Tax=Pseudomonas anatoliensis TaxID=2710589 RepID=UPI001B3264E7|nr:hypothetical protein [Pseudomonas anatoliensis]MBP5954116.1 hypothetical protein [Pseudomonas anatoliensis]